METIDEADKILYFTKGLKAATKAEVNYHSPESLEDAVLMATTYDTAMYGISGTKYYILKKLKAVCRN